MKYSSIFIYSERYQREEISNIYTTLTTIFPVGADGRQYFLVIKKCCTNKILDIPI